MSLGTGIACINIALEHIAQPKENFQRLSFRTTWMPTTGKKAAQTIATKFKRAVALNISKSTAITNLKHSTSTETFTDVAKVRASSI